MTCSACDTQSSASLCFDPHYTFAWQQEVGHQNNSRCNWDTLEFSKSFSAGQSICVTDDTRSSDFSWEYIMIFMILLFHLLVSFDMLTTKGSPGHHGRN